MTDSIVFADLMPVRMRDTLQRKGSVAVPELHGVLRPFNVVAQLTSGVASPEIRIVCPDVTTAHDVAIALGKTDFISKIKAEMYYA